ncbi:hypothetical protein AMTR_s00080p00111220 [Amborella trichopoda]|uniref:Uncharacterized protein n=1 Tax=Amborella trichopoda TaxID=13333 RepID=W1P4W4_AMBTC|nr:hypothetical protein AMTR_s00080p00111220 [Amborella trichopoda]
MVEECFACCFTLVTMVEGAKLVVSTGFACCYLANKVVASNELSSGASALMCSQQAPSEKMLHKPTTGKDA